MFLGHFDCLQRVCCLPTLGDSNQTVGLTSKAHGTNSGNLMGGPQTATVTSGILANQRLPISKFTRLNTKHTTTGVAAVPQIRRKQGIQHILLLRELQPIFRRPHCSLQCVYPNAIGHHCGKPRRLKPPR